MNTLNLRRIFAASMAALVVGAMVPRAEAAEPQLSHSVMFTLKDRSVKSREAFVASCEKYLSGHPGVVFFAVGMIAEDVTEGASDREFDVALHAVFSDKSKLAEYLKSPRHDQFVAENRASFAKVRVFDSYVSAPKVASTATEK